MRSRSLTALALLLVAGVVVLHGRVQDSPRSARPSTDSVGAGIDLYAVADEVAADVERLRGWKFKRPVHKQRTTLAEARRYFEGRFDVVLPPARRAVTEAFLQEVGLVPRGADLRASLATLLEQQVAGYYDPGTSTLHLVERGDDMPPFMQRTVLAHELTHALDDQYVGLEDRGRTPPSEDADVVQGSLTEGSATALMFQYLVGQTMAGKVNAVEAAQYFQKELARAESLAEMPRYFNALFGSYLVGSAFLARGNLQAVLTQPDDRAIGQNFLAAWKTPPRSSEQLLHPEKYWDASKADEPVIADDVSVEAWLAAPGRHIVHRDTLGELLVALLTEPAGSKSPVGKLSNAEGWTNAGAAGWGGDRFFLLAPGADQQSAAAALKSATGAWVTAWDTPQDRDEFAAALRSASAIADAVVVPWRARVALVFIGVDESERQRLIDKLAASPLRFTQAGRNWQP